MSAVIRSESVTVRKREQSMTELGGRLVGAYRFEEPMEVGAVATHHSGGSVVKVSLICADLTAFKQI